MTPEEHKAKAEMFLELAKSTRAIDDAHKSQISRANTHALLANVPERITVKFSGQPLWLTGESSKSPKDIAREKMQRLADLLNEIDTDSNTDLAIQDDPIRDVSFGIQALWSYTSEKWIVTE